MGSIKSEPEVIHDVPPWIKVYKDGTIERLLGYDVTPAQFDPETGVSSKDVVILPDINVSARIYRPKPTTADAGKLPLVIYFHGGAFCIATAFEPMYHNSLNKIASEANVVILSVDYRRAPEFPLPAAFDDSWAALQWAASHASDRQDPKEEWLSKDVVDFDRLFLAGDSAGATIAHQLAIRVVNPDTALGLDIRGILMINPYFWGKVPIGMEITDTFRKAMVDNWWEFVCPLDEDKGCDHPLINPFADGAPAVSGLGSKAVIICVAENDILRDRGRLYYEKLIKSGWHGKAEIVEVEGEDHVFHIFNPNSEKAINMFKRLAAFIKQA